MQTTGPDLRAERRAAEIKVTEIAARMKLTRQTVHALERAAVVEPDRLLLYRQALDDLRDAKMASQSVA